MKCIIAVLLQLVVLTSVEAGVVLPSAADLLDRHIMALGGRDAIERITEVVAEGRYTCGTTGKFEFRARLPGMILLSLTDASGTLRRFGRDPEGRSWSEHQDGLGISEDAVRAGQSALFIALNVGAHLEWRERLGEAFISMDRAQGREVFALGKARVRGASPRLLFQTETFHLVGFGRARFSDFRQVEGIEVPHQLKPTPGLTFVIEHLRFNSGLTEASFVRPGQTRSWLAEFAPKPNFAGGFTNLRSAPDTLQIVRRPAASSWGRGTLSELPSFDPAGYQGWQVDLRNADLRKLDLTSRLPDLLHADFDSKTQWPHRLPEEFDYGRMADLGKDPGLGVRQLHARGVTGRNVGIGIIDSSLLTDHTEYAGRLRMYEEIHVLRGAQAQMHGCAVASIAVGQHCGVAPDADLYYIGVQNAEVTPAGKTEVDYRPVAAAIHRLLDVNTNLPPDRRLRVISISMGWDKRSRGGPESDEAVERARQEGVFVISTSLSRIYGLRFDGLSREAMADPNLAASYGPGSWWAQDFWAGFRRFKTATTLLVPMDQRTVAGPVGIYDYAHYDRGGWSWAVPWVAGLYALACQVRPEITPEAFWAQAIQSGTTVILHHRGEEICLGSIAGPCTLISRWEGSTEPERMASRE